MICPWHACVGQWEGAKALGGLGNHRHNSLIAITMRPQQFMLLSDSPLLSTTVHVIAFARAICSPVLQSLRYQAIASAVDLHYPASISSHLQAHTLSELVT